MMGELDLCEEKSISHIFKLLFEFFRSELNCVVPVEVKKLLGYDVLRINLYFNVVGA